MHERAHAFHVNMNALALLLSDTHLILDALGRSLNCSTVAEGLMFDWKNLFDTKWYDFANLSFLSFHGFDGQELNNTTVTDNPTVLLPVQNGPVTCVLFRSTAALPTRPLSRYQTTAPQPIASSTSSCHR